MSFLSFMYVPSHTLTPWIGFQSPACNDYGRYCSSIVTSPLISDSRYRYWYLESALFTGLNALAPLIIKLYDCMQEGRRWKSLIHDDSHFRNFSGLSQMPASWRKLDIFSENFPYFFYLWKNSRQNTFSAFLWWCSKRKVLSERHLLVQPALHYFMTSVPLEFSKSFFRSLCFIDTNLGLLSKF